MFAEIADRIHTDTEKLQKAVLSLSEFVEENTVVESHLRNLTMRTEALERSGCSEFPEEESELEEEEKSGDDVSTLSFQGWALLILLTTIFFQGVLRLICKH